MCDQNCKCATKYRAHVRRDDLEPECMHDPMSVGEKPTAIAITGTTTMTITLRLATEIMSIGILRKTAARQHECYLFVQPTHDYLMMGESDKLGNDICFGTLCRKGKTKQLQQQQTITFEICLNPQDALRQQ